MSQRRSNKPLSFELLEKSLSGELVTVEDINNIQAVSLKEDLYIEYKDSEELNDAQKASITIRQYMSGFANSDGGILIFGLKDKTLRVTNCTAPGGGDLAAWAATVLTPIAHQFTVKPKIQTLDYTEHDTLLIITVMKSVNYVLCTEKSRPGKPIYYFRIHDQTLEAPEYLLSDIFLGKRSHPTMDLCDVVPRNIKRQVLSFNETDLCFDISFSLQNEGMVWAENCKVGLIFLNRLEVPRNRFFSNSLLANLQIPMLQSINPIRLPENITLNHILLDLPNQIAPFEKIGCFLLEQYQAEFEVPFVTVVSPANKRHQIIWKSVLYLISKNSPPVWFQLTFDTHDIAFDYDEYNRVVAKNYPEIIVEQMYGDRPIVDWEGFYERT